MKKLPFGIGENGRRQYDVLSQEPPVEIPSGGRPPTVSMIIRRR